MNENFESGDIPASWSIYDHGVIDSTWFAAPSGTEWLEPENPGNYYALLDYVIDSLAADTLVSPPVDITQEHSSLYFIYSMAFMGDIDTPDTGIVIIRYYSSTSGWSEWNTLRIYGADLIQETETIDIYSAAQDMDSVQVGFVYSTGDNGGGYFAVDNIEISGDLIVLNDIEVISILSPSGYIGTNQVPVEVVVCNNSSSALTNVPLTVEIIDTTTGLNVYNNSINFDIQGSETITVSLTDFSAPDDTSYYNVIAYTSLTDDSFPSNDTAFAFAYSYPVFGSILAQWEIPSNDSTWWGVDYNRGILYLLNARTGEIKGFNPRTDTFYHVVTLDTIFDNNRIVFWDLAYDYETGNWWVTAFKEGGASNYSYVLKYDSEWNFITGREVPSNNDAIEIGIPSSIDDRPFVSDTLYVASFEFFQPYTLVELDFFNFPDSIRFIDSVAISQLPSGIPATLGVLCDTLFFLQSSGANVINLVSIHNQDSFNLQTSDTLDALPTGGDIEYDYSPTPSNWVVAYLTIEGYKIYKVSMGIRWESVGILENTSKAEQPFRNSLILKNAILPTTLFNKLKGKHVEIYSISGRTIFKGELTSPKLPLKNSGIYFLRSRDVKVKLLYR